MSEDNEEFEEYSKRIGKKLEDEELRKEFDKSLKFISDVYEYPISINIVMNSDPDNLDIIEAYSFDKYSEEMKNINYLEDEYLNLSDVMKILGNEDNVDKKVLLATKHLKPESLNPVNGLMVVGMDDSVIIIPKNKETDEES